MILDSERASKRTNYYFDYLAPDYTLHLSHSLRTQGPLTDSLPRFAVNKLQRFQSNPEPKHFETAQRVFRYLKGTQSEQLRLGGDLVLRAYTDDPCLH